MSERSITRVQVELVTWRTGGAPEDPVGLDEIAEEAGVPATIVKELLALGLAEPVAGSDPPVWPRRAAEDVARCVRLARDLDLNGPGSVLACELLARIAELEHQLARLGRPPPGSA